MRYMYNTIFNPKAYTKGIAIKDILYFNNNGVPIQL